MTSNEMVTVARLADCYEQQVGITAEDALNAATHDFLRFKQLAPTMWRQFTDSKMSDREIGESLCALFIRWSRSGMSLKNFLANEAETSTSPA